MNKGNVLIITAIAAAGLIVAAMSVTSLSILVFAQQEQKPRQQQQQPLRLGPIPELPDSGISASSSTAATITSLIPVYFATGDISMIINMYICLYVLSSSLVL